jgi:hypothetical protein
MKGTGVCLESKEKEYMRERGCGRGWWRSGGVVA